MRSVLRWRGFGADLFPGAKTLSQRFARVGSFLRFGDPDCIKSALVWRGGRFQQTDCKDFCRARAIPEMKRHAQIGPDMAIACEKHRLPASRACLKDNFGKAGIAGALRAHHRGNHGLRQQPAMTIANGVRHALLDLGRPPRGHGGSERMRLAARNRKRLARGKVCRPNGQVAFKCEFHHWPDQCPVPAIKAKPGRLGQLTGTRTHGQARVLSEAGLVKARLRIGIQVLEHDRDLRAL